MADDRHTFDPVRRSPRLCDTIADRMLEAIVTGQFEGGDILPSERELGLQFGVSRTVIREAVRALVTKGVVEVQSGRGARVVRPDAGPVSAAMSLLVRSSEIDFTKLHEVRTMIEQQTAWLAAERGTEENFAELDHLMSDLAEAEKARDIDTASRLDLDFHRAIATSAGNEMFHVLLDSISAGLLANRRATLAIPHNPAKVLEEHRRIVDAIRAHDAEEARRAMTEHLESVAQAWQEAAAKAAG